LHGLPSGTDQQAGLNASHPMQGPSPQWRPRCWLAHWLSEQGRPGRPPHSALPLHSACTLQVEAPCPLAAAASSAGPRRPSCSMQHATQEESSPWRCRM
jgi:hypothetical protein